MAGGNSATLDQVQGKGQASTRFSWNEPRSKDGQQETAAYLPSTLMETITTSFASMVGHIPMKTL
jgi:hypothetical protein